MEKKNMNHQMSMFPTNSREDPENSAGCFKLFQDMSHHFPAHLSISYLDPAPSGKPSRSGLHFSGGHRLGAEMPQEIGNGNDRNFISS